jgi:predicted dehydrogenase
MEIKRIAIIGAGITAKAHIKAFTAQSNVQIIGIYSRTYEKALEVAKEFSIKNVVSSIRDLFYLKVDIVVIAISAESTKEVCQEAFSYPWFLLVEKPVGINFEEASMLRDLAMRHQANVFVALNRRHFSATKQAIEKINTFDEQRLITVMDQEDPILQLSSGEHKNVVKNLMYTNSIHIIDYFSFLGRGEIVKVTPVIKWDNSKSIMLYGMHLVHGLLLFQLQKSDCNCVRWRF